MRKVKRTRVEAAEATFETADFYKAFEAFAENYLRNGTNKNDREAFVNIVEAILSFYYTTDLEIDPDLDDHEVHPGAA